MSDAFVPSDSRAGPVLEVLGIEKRFGGVVALGGVSFDVQAGEILGLIDPNGHGKSTLFDVLTGVQRPDRGSIPLFGEDVPALPAHALARRGLTRTFQLARELDRLTVLENLVLAAPDHLHARQPKPPLIDAPR